MYIILNLSFLQSIHEALYYIDAINDRQLKILHN